MDKKLYRNDIILAVCVVLLAVCIYVAIVLAPKSKTDTVRVETDGNFVMDISLSKDGEYAVSDTGMLLKVENGVMTVLYTDCKDLVCTGMKITKSGGDIICLPNKTVIRPIDKNDADYVTAG